MECIKSSDISLVKDGSDNDDFDRSDKTDVSVGKLQHNLRMLTIKIIEKDAEIKNMKAREVVTIHPNMHNYADKLRVPLITKNVEVQTEYAFITERTDTSMSKLISLMKQDNEYLVNQSSLLGEKLKVQELESKELKCELNKMQCENTSLLARAIAAEESLQILQNDFSTHRQLLGTMVPASLFEKLHLSEESRRERKATESLKELERLRSERDALYQRLKIAEVDAKRLREDMLSIYMKSDHMFRIPTQPDEMLTKTHTVSLEVQLNAACAARKVEQITEKFDAASRAIYEMEATRKVEMSQMEAKLAVVSNKLRMYERVEAELDQTIENFLPARLLEKEANSSDWPFILNLSNRDGKPLIHTLPIRRLEQLSRLLVKTEERRRSLENENKNLNFELKTAKVEVNRLSELIANVDKPTNRLASALLVRDSQISGLQVAKRKLEEKLLRLYDCTKDILNERKAMLSDLKDVYSEVGAVGSYIT